MRKREREKFQNKLLALRKEILREIQDDVKEGREGEAGAVERRSVNSSAKAAIVGPSKNRRSASSTPKTWRIRETARVAVSEWPPRAKKSSRSPTRSIPSTCCQIPARSWAVAFRGARYLLDVRLRRSGTGSARRSTLPLGVNGQAGSAMTAAGTM